MRSKREFDPETIKEIIRLYTVDIIGTPTIGKMFNVGKQVINNLLRENGVEMDSPGRRYLGGRPVAAKKCYEKNKEKIDNYRKEWRKENYDKLHEYHKEWRTGNEVYKKKRTDYERIKLQTNPTHRLISRTRTAVWMSIKERGLIKNDRTFKLLGYTSDELMSHLEKQFKDGMTWDNYGEWHVDHIIPMTLFKFESTDDREFKICWSLANLQPMWGVENYRKGDNYSTTMSDDIIKFFDDEIQPHFNCEFNKKITNKYKGFNFICNIMIPDRKISFIFKPNIHLVNTKYIHQVNDETNVMNDLSYGVIHIYEDEWVLNKELCKSKIKHILSLSQSIKLGARKCLIRDVSIDIKNTFLDANHIQGRDNSTVKLGAYYHDILVGVMTFKTQNNGTFELTRFATDNKYYISGLGSKLLKHFIGEHNPDKIFSFADRRWTVNGDSNLYIKMGFELVDTLRPNYYYFNKDINSFKRYHKFGFRKKILLNKYPDILNENMTEREMTDKLGYGRIYDCGLFKYELKLR